MDTLRAMVAKAVSVVRWPVAEFRRGLGRSLSTLEILLGGFGLVAALLTAALLSPALGALPGAAGDFAPIGMAVLLAPVGIGVALGRRTDVERLLRSISERTDTVADAMTSPREASAKTTTHYVVLDTSAIIDGRLAEVIESGFLMAHLIIPRFVLNELRRVADSSDALKRQRGRYGLQMLARIQASDAITSSIDEQDFPDQPDVDAKVLALARARNGAILTNDFNLNRVAGVEDLRVLNLNALAQAVRTNALPGETFDLRIHQEGRERNQGIGFLQDGTMVVVEDAKHLLQRNVNVEVTRIIQTTAGRMFFARLRSVDGSGDADAADELDAAAEQSAKEVAR